MADNNDENTTCGICFCETDDSDPRVVLDACVHNFHENCILDWSKSSNVCPHCRARFKSVTVYHSHADATRAVEQQRRDSAAGEPRRAAAKPGGKKATNSNSIPILRQHKIKRKNLTFDSSDEELQEGWGVAMLPAEGLVCSVCAKHATDMTKVVLCHRRACEFRAHIDCVGLESVPGLNDGTNWFCEEHRAAAAAAAVDASSPDAAAAAVQQQQSKVSKKLPPKIAPVRTAAAATARQLDFLSLEDQIVDDLVSNSKAEDGGGNNIKTPSNAASAAGSLIFGNDDDEDEDVPLFKRFQQQQQQQSRGASTTSTQLGMTPRPNSNLSQSNQQSAIRSSPAPQAPQQTNPRGWLCDYSDLTPAVSNNNNNNNRGATQQQSQQQQQPLHAHIIDSAFTRSQIVNNSGRFLAQNDDDDDEEGDPFAAAAAVAANRRRGPAAKPAAAKQQQQQQPPVGGLTTVKIRGQLRPGMDAARQMRAFDRQPHPLDSIVLPDPATYGGNDDMIQQQSARGLAELDRRKEATLRTNLMRRVQVEHAQQAKVLPTTALLAGGNQQRQQQQQRRSGGGDALRQLPAPTSMSEASRRQFTAETTGLTSTKITLQSIQQQQRGLGDTGGGAATRALHALSRDEISASEALDRAGGPMSANALELALGGTAAAAGIVSSAPAGRIPNRRQRANNNTTNTNTAQHQFLVQQQQQQLDLLNQSEAQLRGRYFKTYLRSHLAVLNTSSAARAMSEREEQAAYQEAARRAEQDLQSLCGRVARERAIELDKMKVRKAAQEEAALRELLTFVQSRRLIPSQHEMMAASPPPVKQEVKSPAPRPKFKKPPVPPPPPPK